MKTFKVCDSKNGYCHTLKLYVGDEGLQMSPFGKTHDLATSLMAPFANQGYSVYMDNFYTSPYLYYNLGKLGIRATGTSRSRKGYPKDFFGTKLNLKDKGNSVPYFPSPLLSEATQRKFQRLCVVCNPAERKIDANKGETRRRPGRTTMYKCSECNKALCVYPCFELFHTHNDYEKENKTMYFENS